MLERHALVNNGLLKSGIELKVGKELSSNRYESFARPWLKPIDSAAVYEGWKHSESSPEAVSDGGHCQNYMHIGAASVDEKFKCVLRSHSTPTLTSAWANCVNDSHNFVCREKIWNCSCVENIVHILQHGFHHNLGVYK